ncbi:ANTAR domain-containing response regulator [Eggerthella sp. YY7918]|uniref:ANTAR domain-containing response regulator n=1 Tax=Eggerthella sp. (strain YY7918) TaxID=502558 RepID=UPI0002171847|nr:ANTAR domain-containing protein [Eggerthella sp. YY7918]BAK45106.1 response regulator with putative antiterminator output domain [Eggerthella sp. YY7918]
MGLKECVYSVLVVSSSDKFNDDIATLLPELKYSPVRMVSSVHAAQQAFAERTFDFVIINSPLPDDVGMHFAVDVGASTGTVVLFLVRSELYEEVSDRMTKQGIFTLSKPTSKMMIVTAFNWMASVRERLKRFEKKAVSIEDKMEEIRLINRAKWLLISELSMSEPDAHRYIEKQAMDRGATRRQIAEGIIKIYS